MQEKSELPSIQMEPFPVTEKVLWFIIAKFLEENGYKNPFLQLSEKKVSVLNVVSLEHSENHKWVQNEQKMILALQNNDRFCVCLRQEDDFYRKSKDSEWVCLANEVKSYTGSVYRLIEPDFKSWDKEWSWKIRIGQNGVLHDCSEFLRVK